MKNNGINNLDPEGSSSIAKRDLESLRALKEEMELSEREEEALQLSDRTPIVNDPSVRGLAHRVVKDNLAAVAYFSSTVRDNVVPLPDFANHDSRITLGLDLIIQHQDGAIERFIHHSRDGRQGLNRSIKAVIYPIAGSRNQRVSLANPFTHESDGKNYVVGYGLSVPPANSRETFTTIDYYAQVAIGSSSSPTTYFIPAIRPLIKKRELIISRVLARDLSSTAARGTEERAVKLPFHGSTHHFVIHNDQHILIVSHVIAHRHGSDSRIVAQKGTSLNLNQISYSVIDKSSIKSGSIYEVESGVPFIFKSCPIVNGVLKGTSYRHSRLTPIEAEVVAHRTAELEHKMMTMSLPSDNERRRILIT